MKRCTPGSVASIRIRIARPLVSMWTAAALGAALPVAASPSCDPNDSGCQIFNGQRAISAHLRGDDQPLPAWTTRCINCHAAAQTTGAAFAPPLTRESLVSAIRRRGGPPSAYDQASLCYALRDGIDPAHIVLRKSMPLFEVSDADCAALWQFFSQQ